MTEEEALKKWCPFVRLVVREDGNYSDTWSQTNRGEDVNCSTGTNCIGSACMAWRGKEQPWFTNRAEAEFRRTGRRLEPTGADIDGFCGLAGRPL